MNRPENDLDPAKPGKHILLGEDDIDDQEILEEVFSTVDPAAKLQFINNGKKLISHLDDTPDHLLPCLIILDYNMPELNGAEILKSLRDNQRVIKIPKIIWSTSDAPAYKKICLENGACDYLVKPARINLLEDIVRHMLTYCA